VNISKLQEFSNLLDEVENSIERAADLYNKLLLKNKLPYDDQKCWHNGDISYIDIDAGHVCISQNTTWSYGEHILNDCHIPIDALCDETYEKTINNIIEDLKAKQAIEKLQMDEEVYKRKKAQLEKLKAELGE